MLFKIVRVPRTRRVAVVRDGRFVRLLDTGLHLVWTALSVVELVLIDRARLTDEIVLGDPLPLDLPSTRVVTVPQTGLALIRTDGVVRVALGPGLHRVWDEAAEIEPIDALAEPAPLDERDRLPKLPSYVEATAGANTGLILLRDGQPHRVLGPGRYRVWAGSGWTFQAVPLGLLAVELAVQEVLTQDQVPVRVRATATYRIRDPMVHAREAGAADRIYGAVQLALREVVSSRAIEALVQDREALTGELGARAAALLPDVGVELTLVSVKDITLPGEVKDVFHRVTLARKEAEALAIRRREEVATTRQQANTARVLADNPVLMRLKELEALGELAGKVDKLVVVGGGDLVRSLSLSEIRAES